MGEEDLTPPTLTAFSFTPTINTADGPAALPVSFTVTDDLSGAILFDVRFVSPSGAQSRGNGIFFAAMSKAPSVPAAVRACLPDPARRPNRPGVPYTVPYPSAFSALHDSLRYHTVGYA